MAHMVAIQEATRAESRVHLPHRSPLDLALVALIVGFSILGLRPLIDPDLWWHLRTGELVLASGFPGADPWSFASSHTWLLHEWGSEVLMFGAYEIGGYRGVILLHAIAMLALALAVTLSVRRVAEPAIALPIAFLALVGTFLGTAERPQLLSWVLLAVVLPNLRRSVNADMSCWWLVPVIWFWANLHGLWIVALALFAMLVLGRALDRGIRSWRLSQTQVLVGILSTGAACLTPNGPALLLEPFHVHDYAQFVGEWGPPNLQNPLFGATFLLLGLAVVAWARGAAPVPASDLALVLAATAIGLSYIRTMPVLAITVAPIAAEALQRLRGSSSPPAVPNLPRHLLFGGSAIVFVLVAAAWLPFVPTTKESAPWRASSALDDLPGRARVLNQYDLGGWLLWTARDTSPVIDGRTEIYPLQHVSETLDAINGEPGWQRYVQSREFDAALLREEGPLVPLLESVGWTVLLDDHGTLLLVPPDPS